MRLSLNLTLDGLVRALRTKAHDIADDVETDGTVFDRRDAVDGGGEKRPRGGQHTMRGDDDRRRA